MAIQTLQQQKKLNVGLNTDEIIRILKENLNKSFADLITIEQDIYKTINICWFDNSQPLEKQKAEQDILKEILDFNTFVLIWNKIRNWNLNENG